MKDKLMDIKMKMKPWHWWLIIVLGFTIIGGISILGMTKDTYQVLYSELETDDSREIERYLAEAGIPYTVEEAGKIIKVPAEEASRVKMELASQGLPGKANPGFELLDSNNLGSTKDDREVKYHRALKGQLEKDLVDGIEGIEKATVHFESPDEENIFLENEEEAKATVILGLRSGTKLNESQIRGIQNLISAAIKGLTPEKVVIVDEKGSMISDLGSVESGSKQSDIVSQTEGRIKNDILKSLSSVFGYDSVEVTVRAKINFDEIVRNIEKYDPKGTLVSHQENKKEIAKWEAEQGEVGTDANGDVPEYQLEENQEGVMYKETNQEIIENFEVGKTVETIKKNPELTYLSVSVAVDQTMTEEEIEELEEHVSVAAGLMDENNDGVLDNGKVKVTPFVFKQNQETVANPTPEVGNEQKLGTMMIVFAALSVLLVAIFGIFAARKKKKNREKEEAEKLEMQRNEMAGISNGQELLGRIGSMKEDFELEAETHQFRENLNKEATEAVEENPRRTAEYISKLINEG